MSVCSFVRRQFRILIDAAESVRTVGQFRILMNRRNRLGQIVRLADGIFKAKKGQIVRPGKRNSQDEEKKRGGGPARGGDR